MILLTGSRPVYDAIWKSCRERSVCTQRLNTSCPRCFIPLLRPPGIVSRASHQIFKPSALAISLARGPRRRYAASSAEYLTSTEKVQSRLLDAAQLKVEAYRNAFTEDVADKTIDEQKTRAQVLKELGPLAQAWESYQNLRKAIKDLQPHLSDPDPALRELFAAESYSLESELDKLLVDILPRLILPPLSTSFLPALVSINAGAGGAEASLFSEELVKMYLRYAEKRGWNVEVMSRVEGAASQKGGAGGLREMTIRFKPGTNGRGEEGGEPEVYGSLKWERGVHRVQRVPATETLGRLHTSTVAIVVLPIYPDTPDEPLFDPKDVKQEIMRARGPGGQHVNKTESAIRLTHQLTGITVSMQDSRSQHQNREWAYEVLRARLSERKEVEEVEARRASRRSQVKGADRSDKVRTYNFPQDRLTDHRIGFSVNGLQAIMEGDDFELVIQALKRDLDERRIESLLAGEDDIDY